MPGFGFSLGQRVRPVLAPAASAARPRVSPALGVDVQGGFDRVRGQPVPLGGRSRRAGLRTDRSSSRSPSPASAVPARPRTDPPTPPWAPPPRARAFTSVNPVIGCIVTTGYCGSISIRVCAIQRRTRRSGRTTCGRPGSRTTAPIACWCATASPRTPPGSRPRTPRSLTSFGGELPVLLRQVDALEEPDPLLLLGQVQEQLDDLEPVVGEVALPVVDLPVPAPPDVLALRPRAAASAASRFSGWTRTTSTSS